MPTSRPFAPLLVDAEVVVTVPATLEPSGRSVRVVVAGQFDAESIQDSLADLYVLGFLVRHERTKGLSGGQYYEYELALDPMIVLETRDPVERSLE